MIVGLLRLYLFSRIKGKDPSVCRLNLRCGFLICPSHSKGSDTLKQKIELGVSSSLSSVQLVSSFSELTELERSSSLRKHLPACERRKEILYTNQ